MIAAFFSCIQETSTINVFCSLQANAAPGKLSAMAGPEGSFKSGCISGRGTSMNGSMSAAVS